MGERRGDGKPLAYLAAFNARLDYCVFALHSEFIHAKIILRGIFFFFVFALKVIIDNSHSRRGYPLGDG